MAVIPEGLRAACLLLVLALTAASAEPQVLVLSSDKMPSLQPLSAAPAQAQAQAQAAATTPTLPDLQTLQTFQRLQAQALHNLKGLHNLQSLQHLQDLQNLQGAVDRAKRSGNILQLLGGASGGSSSGGASAGAAVGGAGGSGGGGLLGGKGILGSLLSSSSSNSAAGGGLGGGGVVGKGPTYGNLIGTGVGLPMVYGQRSFDLQSFKRSLLGVLMTAVRAITGGVIALKGQLVRVKGQLISAKGNIISASGEALSQFGRNIASNALSPKPPEPPAPPPRPVYGPPGYMVPRPVYGPPPPVFAPQALGPSLGPSLGHSVGHSFGSLGQLPIPRPMYGLPGLPAQSPVFNIYSNAVNHDLPRYQAPVPPPPLPPPPPKVQIQPSIQTYSSHSISGALDSYGPPASGSPFAGTSFSAPSGGLGQSYPSGQGQTAATSYQSGASLSGGGPYQSGPAPPPSPPGGSPYPSGPSPPFSNEPPQGQPSDAYGLPSGSLPQDLNALSFGEHDTTFGAAEAESAGQHSDSYFKRNANQGRDSTPSPFNALQGARAGILLLKPAQNAPPQAKPEKGSETGKLDQSHQSPPAHFSGSSQPLTPGYTSPEFGARIGEGGDTNSNSNKNERTFSLLFGSKKPAPLRPHPVTGALPPQVIAAASAQLAAQLDLAGRAPPRTAVAVSGPQGKFIMYHK